MDPMGYWMIQCVYLYLTQTKPPLNRNVHSIFPTKYITPPTQQEKGSHFLHFNDAVSMVPDFVSPYGRGVHDLPKIKINHSCWTFNRYTLENSRTSTWKYFCFVQGISSRGSIFRWTMFLDLRKLVLGTKSTIHVTPWKINMEHVLMEVWFRSFSFINGWWL